MSFIYCLDEETKNNLLSKGYKFIKSESMQNQTAYVFEYKPEVKFDILQKDKYFISNLMSF